MSDFPASIRVYTPGNVHRSVRVPFRDISLKDKSTMRVYDTRGPWGDPDATCDVRMGLSPLRESWILERTDTEEYAGRNVKPEDNGFLSEKHADQSSGKSIRAVSRRSPPASPCCQQCRCYTVALCKAGDHHSRNGICRDS
jgi:phosphomethylpyrimidine synthase